MTANKENENTYAIERDVMIAGGTDPQIIGFTLPGIVNNPNTVFSPEPANLLGTDVPADVPGYIVYLQDDGWGNGITFDHLKVWEVDVDFTTPANSSVTAPLLIPTAPFDSVFAPFGTGDLEQPGTTQKLDMIGGVISYMANYRSFTDYNSWLVTFNVDVDGEDTSGIRWTELRNSDTEDWSIYQQGTYAPDDGSSRFMGSAAIDAQGNIGMAFNIGSPEKPVGISYTGRYFGDDLGTMTVGEEIIVAGGGVQTNTVRFGDYSQLTMDPDNLRFWHTAEYFSSNNFWTTRIASFQLTGEFENDLAVSTIDSPEDGDLTATESVTINIRNLGTVAQSNFPIELRLDGVLVATETFTGSIEPNAEATFTFAQTVDLSTDGQMYNIEARTTLVDDEAPENDARTKQVRNLFADDIGVSALLSPDNGEGLGFEAITVEITNYGTDSQSNFDVQYSVDGSTPVVETFTGTLAPQGTAEFTFAQTFDFSQVATYSIELRTLLANDSDTSNDVLNLDIINSYCLPQALQGCQVDGIKKFVLNTIDADDGGDGCNTEPESSPAGYADRTNLSTTLLNIAGLNSYTLQAQHNWNNGANIEALSVWIDFNDDGAFDDSEQLISGEFFTSFDVLEDFELVIPPGAALGPHRLRAKAIDTSAAGDIDNACSDFQFGEVQDYTVIISDQLPPEDVGVTAILAPESGVALGNEDVTVEISNFGSADQSNFDVQYTVNGGTAVVENFAGSVTVGANVTYTFTQQADLSTPDVYVIEASTNLSGDVNASNDSFTKTVESTLSIEQVLQTNTDLLVTTTDNQNFEVSLQTPFEGAVYMSLTNTLGQQVTYKPIARDANGFSIRLDLSALASGVYFIGVNNQAGSFKKIEKIVVR